MSGTMAELVHVPLPLHTMHQPVVLLPPLYCRRYWIYAAVTAGEHGLLVSNDEMRDHIFQVGVLLAGWRAQ